MYKVKKVYHWYGVVDVEVNKITEVVIFNIGWKFRD